MASAAEPSLSSRLSAVYNFCIQSPKNGLQELNGLILEAEMTGLQSKELAVCYALRAEHAIEDERFEQAYNDIRRAQNIFPQSVEVLHGLINVHWRAKDSRGKNPHVSDSLCKRYTQELESLGCADTRVLDFCSRVYGSLEMFDDGLGCLTKMRDLSISADNVSQINKRLTDMYVSRYEACPETKNVLVISRLMNLLEFKENTLEEEERNQAFAELMERMQWVLNEAKPGFRNTVFESRDVLIKWIEFLTFDGIGVTVNVLDLARQLFVAVEDADNGVKYMTKCLRTNSALRSEILLSRSCFYAQLGDISRSHEDFVASNAEGRGLDSSKFVAITSQFEMGWQKKQSRSRNVSNDVLVTFEPPPKTSVSAPPKTGTSQKELKKRIATLESELNGIRGKNEAFLLRTTDNGDGELQELKMRVREYEVIISNQGRDVQLRDEAIQDLREEATTSSEYVGTLCARVDRLVQENEDLKVEVERLEQELETVVRGSHTMEPVQRRRSKEDGSDFWNAKQSGSCTFCWHWIVRAVVVLLAVCITIFGALALDALDAENLE